MKKHCPDPSRARRRSRGHDKSTRKPYKVKTARAAYPVLTAPEKFHLPASTYHTNRLLCFTYRLSSLSGSR